MATVLLKIQTLKGVRNYHTVSRHHLHVSRAEVSNETKCIKIETSPLRSV